MNLKMSVRVAYENLFDKYVGTNILRNPMLQLVFTVDAIEHPKISFEYMQSLGIMLETSHLGTKNISI